MLNKTNPVKTRAWKKLEAHYAAVKTRHMKDMFDEDPDRFSKFSIGFDNILFDYSSFFI